MLPLPPVRSTYLAVLVTVPKKLSAMTDSFSAASRWVALPKELTLDGNTLSKTFHARGFATEVDVPMIAAVVMPANSQLRIVTLLAPPSSSIPHFPERKRQFSKTTCEASYSSSPESALRDKEIAASSTGASNATLMNFHPRPRTTSNGVVAVGEAAGRHMDAPRSEEHTS